MLARLFWGMCLALLPIGRAAAQHVESGDVAVDVEYAWPEVVSKGYVPVRVRASNGGDSPADIEVRIRQNGWTAEPIAESRRALRLDAHAQGEFELLVPSFGLRHQGLSYVVELDAPEGRRQEGLSLQFSGRESLVRKLLLITEERLAPGATDRLAELWKDGDIGGQSRIRSATPAPGTPDVDVTAVTFDELSERHAAYSSLDAVLVDLRHGRVDPESMRALLTWVRLGGRAAFIAEDPRAELARWPGLERAFDSRLRSSSFGTEMRDSLYLHGLGHLLLAPRALGELETTDRNEIGRRLLVSPGAVDGKGGSWVPSNGVSRLPSQALPIPGIGRLPMRTFLVVLFAFGLLIGPLNLAWVRHRGRPAMLLWTVPLLSVFVSFGVLAYGIFYQGVDVKAVRHSLTWLDQRERRGDTIELRTIYAGLSPGDGLLPASGTAVFPQGFDDNARVFEFDATGSTALRRGYLPVRDPMGQVVQSEKQVRERLHVRKSEGRIEVENAFLVALQGLYLRDANGVWFTTKERIEPGAKATLSQFDGRAPSTHPQLASTNLLGFASPLVENLQLPASAYVTRLATDAFGDDCAIEMNVLAGEHLLVGLLPAREEEWE